jgi:hypothetical protein
MMKNIWSVAASGKIMPIQRSLLLDQRLANGVRRKESGRRKRTGGSNGIGSETQRPGVDLKKPSNCMRAVQESAGKSRMNEKSCDEI